MILTFRAVTNQPKEWKPAWEHRPTPPWDATYARTLNDLDRELGHLGGSDPFLQLMLEPKDLRLDGQVRSGATPDHPGVILTFDTKTLGSMTYSTDRFAHWHYNLRAITLTLDRLRAVERYGAVHASQQYAGFRELGSGIPLGERVVETMSAAEAALVLTDGVWQGERTPEAVKPMVEFLFREQAKRVHPDNGGDADSFRRLVMARNLLANL